MTNQTLTNHSNKRITKVRFICILLLCFLFLMVCLMLTLYLSGRHQFQQRLSHQISGTVPDGERYYFQTPTAPPAPFSNADLSHLTYQGINYTRNPNLIVLYMMGIDSDAPVSSAAATEGGQSDANFLIFIDTFQKNIRLASINRNAMTEIDIYDAFDEYGYTIPGQLCLQHAYGDGMQESCERSCDALSRLLYQMPVNGYYALQKGAIAAINDCIGGVEVTALEDVIFPEPETIIHKGEDILLLGNNAYYYLTFRYVENFGSNNGRLERERQYIDAFLNKFYTSSIHNPLILFHCYHTLQRYSVTDLSLPELFYLLFLSQQYTIDTNVYNLPGETVQEGSYECYYIPDEDMTSFILDYFYIEESF